MLFNSFIFFIFLGIVLPTFYLLPSKKSKNIFLLFASYFFYGYWDWRFCSLLAISTLVDFSVGKFMYITENSNKRKLLLTLSLISNLGILGFFKYFNFFIDSFQMISGKFGVDLDFLHLNIILPVGISFYTFQTLSYTIDIYRKKLEPTNNFVDFALFVSFFPQLVAGPIERARSLLPQLSNKLHPTKEQIKNGVTLIIIGLFKKVIIGDTAGRYVDNIFGEMELYKSVELISALVLFAIQIYADFSGYSYIARGTAKLLGVDLMVNFKQPYLSRSITEFWRRWHISLSNWLRDYLYISLGGNRINKRRTYINLMATMLLGGLWHGASWNFVIWGGLHGIYLVIHKLILGQRKIDSSNAEKINLRIILNVFLTNILVLITWLFFRSTSWDTTKLYFDKIFHWESSEYSFWFMKITITYLIFVLLLDLSEYLKEGKYSLFNIKSNYIKFSILACAFLITLAYMLQAKTAPFIYFAF